MDSERDEKAGDERLRAVIADDDPFARRVIKDALTEAGVLVIAEARNGHEAVEMALLHRPDVIVMDIVMPGLDGILATRQILKMVPDQLVIMLTGANDEDDELGLLALRAGAAGYISKDVGINALPRALEAASAGEAAISRKMTKRVIEWLRRDPGGYYGMRPVKSPLTGREWEFIDLLKATRSTDEMAAELVLSTETVRSHIKNILRKLGVHSRQEAVTVADKMRSTSPPVDDPENGSRPA